MNLPSLDGHGASEDEVPDRKLRHPHLTSPIKGKGSKRWPRTNLLAKKWIPAYKAV